MRHWSGGVSAKQSFDATIVTCTHFSCALFTWLDKSISTLTMKYLIHLACWAALLSGIGAAVPTSNSSQEAQLSVVACYTSSNLSVIHSHQENCLKPLEHLICCIQIGAITASFLLFIICYLFYRFKSTSKTIQV